MKVYTVISVKFNNESVAHTIEPPVTFSTGTKAMQYVMREYKDLNIVDREYESHVLYEFRCGTDYYITITQTELDA